MAKLRNMAPHRGLLKEEEKMGGARPQFPGKGDYSFLAIPH